MPPTLLGGNDFSLKAFILRFGDRLIRAKSGEALKEISPSFDGRPLSSQTAQECLPLLEESLIARAEDLTIERGGEGTPIFKVGAEQMTHGVCRGSGQTGLEDYARNETEAESGLEGASANARSRCADKRGDECLPSGVVELDFVDAGERTNEIDLDRNNGCDVEKWN